MENWVLYWYFGKSNIKNKENSTLYLNASIIFLDVSSFFHQLNRLLFNVLGLCNYISL